MSVALDGDVAIPIRSPDSCPDGTQTGHCFRRGVAVAVAAHADHRGLWPDLRKEGGRRGGPRSVMSHLQHIGLTKLPGQRRLGHHPRIAHQQGPKRSPTDLEDGRVLVQIVPGVRPLRRWMKYSKPDPIEVPFLPGRDRAPPDASTGHHLEPRVVRRLHERLTRFERHAQRHRRGDRRRTADVVAVRMREHHRLDPFGTQAAEQREHHPLACIPSFVGWTSIDHDPAARRRPDQCGVPLTDIREN